MLIETATEPNLLIKVVLIIFLIWLFIAATGVLLAVITSRRSTLKSRVALDGHDRAEKREQDWYGPREGHIPTET